MTTAPLHPATDLLTVTVAGAAPVVRITVVGEIDSSSAPLLRQELDALLESGTAQEITVDLTGVTFLDSAGLCVLASAHRRAGAQDAALRVLASSRAVVRPLEITGLWDLFRAEQVERSTAV